MTRFLMVAVMALALPVASTRAADGPKAVKGPEEVLGQEDGEWDAEVTVTLSGEDKPVTSKAVESNRLLGGKWLVSDFRGEFAGQPFEGHGQYGFDVKKGKYVGTWIDVMSTRIDTMEGTYDEKTKTLTMYCEMVDPKSGKPLMGRFVTVFQEGGSRIFTESLKADGASDYAKFMEITYKKRKK